MLFANLAAFPPLGGGMLSTDPPVGLEPLELLVVNHTTRLALAPLGPYLELITNRTQLILVRSYDQP